MPDNRLNLALIDGQLLPDAIDRLYQHEVLTAAEILPGCHDGHKWFSAYRWGAVRPSWTGLSVVEETIEFKGCHPSAEISGACAAVLHLAVMDVAKAWHERKIDLIGIRLAADHYTEETIDPSPLVMDEFIFERGRAVVFRPRRHDRAPEEFVNVKVKVRAATPRRAQTPKIFDVDKAVNLVVEALSLSRGRGKIQTIMRGLRINESIHPEVARRTQHLRAGRGRRPAK